MRCHYEILEVARDADDETIKKAYRKLALKWHPDKNPDRTEECTKHFALLQQAWEVLSDPHERSWYDRHRDSILRGGVEDGGKDDSLNLFCFFSSSCYSGFGDEKQGFYSVYRKVFEDLMNEDYGYHDDPKDAIYPTFGNSKSSSDEVNAFYGFWSAFSTVRTFAWAGDYDIRNAPNRFTLRAMEKENKKQRDAMKKERNDQIRELVRFVRRRDPRVQAYREELEQRRLLVEKKTDEARRQQILQHLQSIGEHNESEENRTAHLESLREIEDSLIAEFGGESSDEGEEDEEENVLSCIVCDKVFKTMNAKVNHEKSKQHKKALAELKRHMREEDMLLLDERPEEKEDDQESPDMPTKKSKKQKKKARRGKESDDDEIVENAASEPVAQLAETFADTQIDKEGTTLVSQVVDTDENLTEKKRKKKEKQAKQKEIQPEVPTGPKPASCDLCHEWFPSRSLLFEHLKETGHATLKTAEASNKKTKKGKK